MSLEEIVEIYGWNDYLDMHTGYIYKLSEVVTIDECTSKVPVINETGILIGYTKINKIKE